MHVGRFVFSELIAHLPHQEFQKCVARYDDRPQPRKFTYWDQYLAMAFAQLNYRESLRDIEACLRSVTGKLYHLSDVNYFSRSTTIILPSRLNLLIFFCSPGGGRAEPDRRGAGVGVLVGPHQP